MTPGGEPAAPGSSGTPGSVPGDEPQPSVGEVARPPWADQPGVAVEDLQRMWAPWRFGYIAGGEDLDGCPFCVLPAREPGRDRESLILYRGEHCYVIFNAYPYNPGHLMVVPFGHEGYLDALPPEAREELWRLGERTVSVLRERLGCQGINLGMNLGVAAGAGIAEHLHLHAVPRWIADTNFITVVGASRVLPRALEELYDELAPAFGDETDED